MSADKLVEIVGADFINGRELLVNFSDQTSTVYSVKQLLEIRTTRNVPAPANSRLLEQEPSAS
jgi:hypothetical protein